MALFRCSSEQAKAAEKRLSSLSSFSAWRDDMSNGNEISVEL